MTDAFSMWNLFCKDMEVHQYQKEIWAFGTLIEKANLFVFEKTVVPISSSLSTKDLDFNELHLPFDTVAIVSPDVVFLLTEHDKETGDATLRTRKFGLWYEDQKDAGVLNAFSVIYDEGEGAYDLQIVGNTVFPKDGECYSIYDLDDLAEYNQQEETKATRNGMGREILKLFLMLDSRNFILEEQPKKIRKATKKKGAWKFPRAHERSIFTILRPRIIREKIGLPSLAKGQEGVKTPHERRGHWRTYRDDRFVNKQGKRQWIDATWVGHAEAQIGNKFYKVRLDL